MTVIEFPSCDFHRPRRITSPPKCTCTPTGHPHTRSIGTDTPAPPRNAIGAVPARLRRRAVSAIPVPLHLDINRAAAQLRRRRRRCRGQVRRDAAR